MWVPSGRWAGSRVVQPILPDRPVGARRGYLGAREVLAATCPRSRWRERLKTARPHKFDDRGDQSAHDAGEERGTSDGCDDRDEGRRNAGPGERSEGRLVQFVEVAEGHAPPRCPSHIYDSDKPTAEEEACRNDNSPLLC